MWHTSIQWFAPHHCIYFLIILVPDGRWQKRIWEGFNYSLSLVCEEIFGKQVLLPSSDRPRFVLRSMQLVRSHPLWNRNFINPDFKLQNDEYAYRYRAYSLCTKRNCRHDCVRDAHCPLRIMENLLELLNIMPHCSTKVGGDRAWLRAEGIVGPW